VTGWAWSTVDCEPVELLDPLELDDGVVVPVEVPLEVDVLDVFEDVDVALLEPVELAALVPPPEPAPHQPVAYVMISAMATAAITHGMAAAGPGPDGRWAPRRS
jgi:hypothetical protein